MRGTGSRSPQARRSQTRWSRCTRCQRFLDPEGLRTAASSTLTAGRLPLARSWTRWRLPRTGRRLRPRSRFARFVNLPELQQMFRSFADVQTAEMLDLPPPRLGPESRLSLPARCQTSRRTSKATRGPLRADPLPEGGPARGQCPGDHDRRPKACPRCPAPLRRPEDFPESKVNALVERVADHLATHRDIAARR